MQKAEASRVFENWHMKVARLSALRIGIPMENLWYSFLLEAESNIVSYCGRRNEVNKKSNNFTGNRTRYFPVCCTVPQPTAPPRTPFPLVDIDTKIILHLNLKL